MRKSNITLERSNHGKPTNPVVQINPEVASETIPQAWEYKDDWYYNFPGAVAECGELLPTVEQWKQYIEENQNFRENLHKYGSRYGNEQYGDNGRYCNYDGGGYYWSSSPSGTNAFSLGYTPSFVWHNLANNRSFGLSVRCIKE